VHAAYGGTGRCWGGEGGVGKVLRWLTFSAACSLAQCVAAVRGVLIERHALADVSYIPSNSVWQPTEDGLAMIVDPEKTEFNRRVKAKMHADLQAKTWVEKVESIARMNKAGKIAREAMRKAQAAMKTEAP
jgi:hypothetical protein